MKENGQRRNKYLVLGRNIS